ncbi:MAG: 4-hydroxythreonine-4-phosphate dehydrogenase PdxA [Prolixibacteraceae bacterium]|jgi:4-hydroxythreonine-4-phosphate dehydrogenase|nr:4-hydroxythreonine-4-phosphate dehydrogenase PdxA [Prolixibacteraceae bacterium]
MINQKTYKPILAITMGDPSGIGPEISAKAFANTQLYDQSRPLLIGNANVIKNAINMCGLSLDVNIVNHVEEAKFQAGVIDMLTIPIANSEDITYGEINARSGDLAFKCVRKAIELAMEGKVDGTVTGPINKASIHAAGHKFSGHTEIYAHYTGTDNYAMLLADEKMKVIHVSTHVALREACDRVKTSRVFDVIGLLNEGLKKIGILNPRIGVAGLNPHASDEGLFGSEEKMEIQPAVEKARAGGIDASGPYPPDTLFSLAAGGKFDGCVAMYHDQGHIPFKMVGFVWDEETGKMKSVKGVNITLGLPIIRTSVDHGTAFEIAGKGIASPDALLYAVEYAVLLHKNNTKK